jgi:hypothetical protein
MLNAGLDRPVVRVPEAGEVVADGGLNQHFVDLEGSVARPGEGHGRPEDAER